MRVSGKLVVLMLPLVAAVSFGVHAEADWPGLRGPGFDGAVRDVQLFDGGGASLAVGWRRAVGSGYAAVAVGNGRVVTAFASGDHDVVAAFDVESGDELWRYRIGETYAGHDGSHDGPIATPLLSGGRVYGLGAWGQLFALDAADGKQVWSTHLVDDHGAKKPFYGFSSSPIMVDGVLVVQIGAGEGKAIGGFDPAEGELLWTVGDDTIDYQSPIAADIGGRQQALALGDKRLFGIDARSGEVLWSHEHGGDESAIGAGSMIPVPAGENRFLLLNKRDSSSMIEVTKDKQGGFEVSELWSSNAVRGTYATPVYHDGYLYGMTGRILTCVDAATGETKWRSREPGDGFPTLVGDHLVIITKPGGLHVAEASPEGYREVSKLDLFGEHSWSEVAFAGGHLFARSMGHLARVDLGAAAAKATMDSDRAWLVDTEFGGFLADLDTASDKSGAIDAFLARQDSFPIVESPDVVHFVFRGEAEDVGLVGDLIGARREDPMTRVEGTDLFYYSARLEPDAAVTYGFIKDYGEEAIADPLNPRSGKGLFGEVSLLSMPAREEPDHIAEAPASRQGKLESVEWDSQAREGQKRTAQVYLPAGYDESADRKYPVLYVHGGKAALEDGAMKNSLDNLIGETVQPLIAVFVMPPDDEEAARADMRQTDAYLDMVVNELVPMIDERYPTIRDARSRASVGVGRGGSTGLYGAFRSPGVFGRVGSQSGIWMLGGERPIEELIPGASRHPLTIYLEWGEYDLRSPHEAWDMAEDNRKMQRLLRERGYRPAGGEVPEGFGWGCWRGRTDEVLAALFPMGRDRS